MYHAEPRTVLEAGLLLGRRPRDKHLHRQVTVQVWGSSWVELLEGLKVRLETMDFATVFMKVVDFLQDQEWDFEPVS